jgi:hypothetical protein
MFTDMDGGPSKGAKNRAVDPEHKTSQAISSLTCTKSQHSKWEGYFYICKHHTWIYYRVCLKNTFSPLQVKNKPHDGEMEHAFILVSQDCTVVNNINLKIDGAEHLVNKQYCTGHITDITDCSRQEKNILNCLLLTRNNTGGTRFRRYFNDRGGWGWGVGMQQSNQTNPQSSNIRLIPRVAIWG